MKIVCDACATKYSISDDKVAGKAFKVRCKTCGNTIVARAPAPVPAPKVEEGSGLLDIKFLAGSLVKPPSAAMASSDLPTLPPSVAPIAMMPMRPVRDRKLVYAVGALAGLLAVVTTLLVVLASRHGHM